MLYVSKYGGNNKKGPDSSANIHSTLESMQSHAYGNYAVHSVDPQLFASSVPAPSIALVVDPLSPAGMRALGSLVPLLQALAYPYTLVLVPQLHYAEVPLQSFFRFKGLDGEGEGLLRLAPSTSTSTGEEEDEGSSSPASGGEEAHGGVVFASLPTQHTLTTRVDPPEAWNVQTQRAQQDIDNLRCAGSGSGMCGDQGVHGDVTYITYSLKSMLVSGQCFEADGRGTSARARGRLAPPQGLQITLSSLAYAAENQSVSQRRVGDSLVMQTLGYYQLQAPGPALYAIGLASGRARDIYQIVTSHSQGQSQDAEDEASGGAEVIVLKDFNDHVRRFSVAKRPGKEHLSLLDDNNNANSASSKSDGGLWNTFTSLFGEKTADKDKADDTIHVFSLATGHVYERLLRIMMLSVRQSTSSPVTFWLFENYLSPSFKDMAMAMSEKYGFNVQYVTYKWPQWLHPQTQQQRIIWGYKILFLDVLFPLNVTKVIYIDADQVLRSDIKELYDLDLHGAPYAYTPFCDSRKDMLGYQFWRGGYWKDHLMGKPYHISALYVVDLATFRYVFMSLYIGLNIAHFLLEGPEQSKL